MVVHQRMLVWCMAEQGLCTGCLSRQAAGRAVKQGRTTGCDFATCSLVVLQVWQHKGSCSVAPEQETSLAVVVFQDFGKADCCVSTHNVVEAMLVKQNARLKV